MTDYETRLLAALKTEIPGSWGNPGIGAAASLPVGTDAQTLRQVLEREALTYAHHVLHAAIHAGIVKPA